MRSSMLALVVLAVASSVVGGSEAGLRTATKTRQPRSLAAEARWEARHGGVRSHAYGDATVRMKALSRRLVVARFGRSSYALGRMLCVVDRESGWNPGAISSGNDQGLFQVNYSAHHSSYDFTHGHMLDPAYNVAVAWRLSDGGRDFGPWAGGSHPC